MTVFYKNYTLTGTPSEIKEFIHLMEDIEEYSPTYAPYIPQTTSTCDQIMPDKLKGWEVTC